MEAIGTWVTLSSEGLIGAIFDLFAGNGDHAGLAGLASNVAALIGLL